MKALKHGKSRARFHDLIDQQESARRKAYDDASSNARLLAQESAAQLQTSHARIEQLEDREMEMILRLRNTQAQQKGAMSALGQKSSAVKKAVSPRQAYKYKRGSGVNLQFRTKFEEVKTPVERKQ